MDFDKGHLYHIYNQGNNQQMIFFNKENYLFFLKKIRIHVLPFADILAWCLMPNHFHLMGKVNQMEQEMMCRTTGSATQSRAPSLSYRAAESPYHEFNHPKFLLFHFAFNHLK